MTKAKILIYISKNKIVIFSFLLGLLAFLFIYGPGTLDPTNTRWLLNAGDLTQHFLGWSFFRNDNWSFPLGKTISYGYPFGISITYTDSVPLLAFIFKLINPILPHNFQYFGIWELICFALSGVFAALILKLFTKNNLLVASGVLFFIFSPVMIFRVAGHNALSGQWIVLWALYLFLSSTKEKIQVNIANWIIVNFVSILVHPYLTLMVLVIYFGYEINKFLAERKILQNLLRIVAVLASLILAVVILGLYSSDISLLEPGLGYTSMNLNALVNPIGWSKYFLKDLPLESVWQYEGFNYLGFGMILLAITALVVYFKNIFSRKKESTSKFINVGIIFIILFCLFFSLSNRVTFSNHLLFSYPLPKIVEKAWSIFRATGRIFWPVYYLIYIFVFIQLFGLVKTRRGELLLAVVLLLAVTLQVVDIKPGLDYSNKVFSAKNNYTDPFKSDFWQKILEHKHIVVLPPYEKNSSDKGFYDIIADYSARNKLTVNSGYFARGPYDKISEFANEKTDSLESGVFNPDEIYILRDRVFFDRLKAKYQNQANFMEVDGYSVIYAKNFNLN